MGHCVGIEEKEFVTLDAGGIGGVAADGPAGQVLIREVSHGQIIFVVGSFADRLRRYGFRAKGF
jgi:hypothetical protein